MFDPAQILLFVVIIILTTLLLVLGIQVYFILKELRKTIDKANKVLDNADIITESVAIPVSTLSNLIMGLKTGAGFANIIRKAVDFGSEGDRNGK